PHRADVVADRVEVDRGPARPTAPPPARALGRLGGRGVAGRRQRPYPLVGAAPSHGPCQYTGPAGRRFGSRFMKAVVMAGGEGSRLRPLTINRPKPMVPIVNKPVMEHVLDLLKRHGIRDVIVTVQY